MNSRDRYTIENKKKKKTPTITGKSNQTTQNTSTYVSSLVKNDIEKTDKTQKSARNIKNEANPKLLKTERSFKVLNNLSNRSVSYVDNYAIRPKTTTHATKATKENQDILADIEVRYGLRENFDPNHASKRWSDIPTRTSDLTFGTNLTTATYINSRQKVDSIPTNMDESPMNSNSKNSKIHNRNYSFTKAQAIQEVQKPSLSNKISAIKAQNTGKNSKITHQKNDGQLNNTAISLVSQETIYEETSPYDFNPQRQKSFPDEPKSSIPKQVSIFHFNN
jgi:hypothetical protein